MFLNFGFGMPKNWSAVVFFVISYFMYVDIGFLSPISVTIAFTKTYLISLAMLKCSFQCVRSFFFYLLAFLLVTYLLMNSLSLDRLSTALVLLRLLI